MNAVSKHKLTVLDPITIIMTNTPIAHLRNEKARNGFFTKSMTAAKINSNLVIIYKPTPKYIYDKWTQLLKIALLT